MRGEARRPGRSTLSRALSPSAALDFKILSSIFHLPFSGQFCPILSLLCRFQMAPQNPCYAPRQHPADTGHPQTTTREFAMSGTGDQHIGDSQLISGLPKHMAAVAGAGENTYWEIVPDENACATCRSLRECVSRGILSRFIRTARVRSYGCPRRRGRRGLWLSVICRGMETTTQSNSKQGR